MITVGMDVHVRNSYLHVTDDAGDVIRHGRGTTNVGGFFHYAKTRRSVPLCGTGGGLFAGMHIE